MEHVGDNAGAMDSNNLISFITSQASNHSKLRTDTILHHGLCIKCLSAFATEVISLFSCMFSTNDAT